MTQSNESAGRPVYASLVAAESESGDQSHPNYMEGFANLKELVEKAGFLRWAPNGANYTQESAEEFLNAEVGKIWKTIMTTNFVAVSNDSIPIGPKKWKANTAGLVYCHAGNDQAPSEFAYTNHKEQVLVAHIYVITG